jgi:hypothetical protein
MSQRRVTIYCRNCRHSTLGYQERPNHVLHLIATLFLCGAWLPVWLLLCCLPGPKKCGRCGMAGR